MYGLNYLDKTTLSYASIMGLREDINLVGDNYQWLGTSATPFPSLLHVSHPKHKN